MSDPYRTEALAVVEPERAFCPWCTHGCASLSSGRSTCTAPSQCSPSGERQTVEYVNRDGCCPSYAPSWWTRLMRRFGWGREPMARVAQPATRRIPRGPLGID